MVQKIFARASNLLHDMRHQAQVALNENIAGLQIPLGGFFQIVALFLGRQGFGKAARLQLQRIEHIAQDQPNGG